MERLHVDLFTGLAGFSLAARANGVRTIAMCEIDPRCRAFLAKAWPGVPIWDDVRSFDLADANERRLQVGWSESGTGICERNGCDISNAIEDATCNAIWLLTAGVPCQPASRAGKQRGAADDRWLWEPALAVLADLLPTWALLENPPGIGDVGLAGILSQVEALGYEVRVFGIPACAVGAPHRRERYWIVAHREGGALGTGLCPAEPGRERGRRSSDDDGERVADASERGQREHGGAPGNAGYADECDEGGVADTGCLGGREDESERGAEGRGTDWGTDPWADAVWLPCADGKVRRAPGYTFGLVDGLHRSVLAALGNSIVWPVAARIIAAMIEAEQP